MRHDEQKGSAMEQQIKRGWKDQRARSAKQRERGLTHGTTMEDGWRPESVAARVGRSAADMRSESDAESSRVRSRAAA